MFTPLTLTSDLKVEIVPDWCSREFSRAAMAWLLDSVASLLLLIAPVLVLIESLLVPMFCVLDCMAFLSSLIAPVLVPMSKALAEISSELSMISASISMMLAAMAAVFTLNLDVSAKISPSSCDNLFSKASFEGWLAKTVEKRASRMRKDMLHKLCNHTPH